MEFKKKKKSDPEILGKQRGQYKSWKSWYRAIANGILSQNMHFQKYK